jgi:hypothetical protein
MAQETTVLKLDFELRHLLCRIISALTAMETAVFRFNCVSFAAVAAISVLCGTSAHAASILIDQGNTTYDPASKLQWLDLTATRGLSYNNVLNNVSVDYVATGWRFATEGEVDQLYRDAGLPLVTNPDGSFSFFSNPMQPGYAALEQDAHNLGSELGWTLPDYSLSALFDVTRNPPDSEAPGVTTLEVYGYLGGPPETSSGREINVFDFLNIARKDDYIRNLASFLVRDNVSAVPIPGQAVSLAAMLLGLVGFNLWRRKQLS